MVPKGVVNLNMIWVEAKFMPANNRIDLTIVGSSRTFRLKCADSFIFKEWQNCFEQSIERSLGKMNKVVIPKKTLSIWKTHRIDENDLIKQAQVGDLLILKSRGKMSVGLLLISISEQQKQELLVMRGGVS